MVSIRWYLKGSWGVLVWSIRGFSTRNRNYGLLHMLHVFGKSHTRPLTPRSKHELTERAAHAFQPGAEYFSGSGPSYLTAVTVPLNDGFKHVLTAFFA